MNLELQSNAMPLTDLPIWNQLLSGEPDPYGRLALALAAQLRAEDMDELIALADHGAEKHSRLALSVLLDGHLRDNPRFHQDQIERLAKVALRYVKESFPFEPGWSYFVILSRLDPGVAGDSIADLEVSDAWETPILMRVLSSMGKSKKSSTRLHQLSSRKDRIGEMATQYLEAMGVISAEKLEQLGAEFREKHTARALNRIHSYILTQVNRPVAPILKLLGAPTARPGNAYIYEAEGIQLYMEQDAEGNLSGLKIK